MASYKNVVAYSVNLYGKNLCIYTCVMHKAFHRCWTGGLFIMEHLLEEMMKVWQEERLQEQVEEKAEEYFRNYIDEHIDDYLKIDDQLLREEFIDNIVQLAVSVYHSKNTLNLEQATDWMANMGKQILLGKAKRELQNEIDRRMENSSDEVKLVAKFTSTLLDNDEVCKDINDYAEVVTYIAKEEATEYAAQMIGGGAKKGVEQVGEILKLGGKGNSNRNKITKELIGSVAENIEGYTQENIHAIFSGEKNVEDALKDTLVETGKNVATNYVKAHAENAVRSLVDTGSKNLGLKASGSEHELRNNAVDLTKDVLTTELATNVLAGFTDVVSGKKKIVEATTDVVIESGKNVVLDVGKKQGAEIVVKIINELEKQAEAKIHNQIAKNVATNALKKVGNANTVIQVSGAVYDIGSSVKAYMNGEIDGAQLVRDIGQNASDVIVSSVFAMAGAMVAGPLGAAIGSMVGSIATTMLYNGILQAFESAKQSKLNYERNHALVEESIRIMRVRRKQFEFDVEELLGHRSEVIKQSFYTMDVAIAEDDMNCFIEGIENIVTEFGGEMQFHNMEEFDDFMISDDVFKL